MSRGGSSGGGRSSLSYLFEPEETILYRRTHTTAKSNLETEKAPDTNSRSVKDEKKVIRTEVVHSPPKREVSNPILTSHKPPCNIYHTSQLSNNNSRLLITAVTLDTLSPAHPPVPVLCVHLSPQSASTGRGERPGRRTCHKDRHGRRSVRRRDDRLRRQERAARGRGAPQGASPRRARPAVLAAHHHHHQGRSRPWARHRHVLRAAGHGAADGPRSSGVGACAGDGAGRGGQGRGGAARRGEEGAEAVRAADVPGGRRDVQPRRHVHGRRRRVLSLQLANGGRRGAGERDVGHVCALRRRGGRDGVLGAVGAPGAVARLAVAHARVAPPAARGPLRAQRRLRHRQRRAGHLPPRLRLLPPGPRARPMLRRGPRDYALRHGLHVRPRRPGPPPLPGRPHRQRAILPTSGCRSQDTPHGQVRGRPVWALPGTKGAGGGWWPGRAGKGARANQPDHLMPDGFVVRPDSGAPSSSPLGAVVFRFWSPTTTTPEAIRFGCTAVDVGCPAFWGSEAQFVLSFVFGCHCHVGAFVETSHVLVPCIIVLC